MNRKKKTDTLALVIGGTFLGRSRHLVATVVLTRCALTGVCWHHVVLSQIKYRMVMLRALPMFQVAQVGNCTTPIRSAAAVIAGHPPPPLGEVCSACQAAGTTCLR